MVVKSNFSKQDFVHILSNYDLGTYQNAEPISDGTVQTNLLVTTSSGKYVFKYYENRTENSVRFEAAVIDFISQHHFPCAAAIKNQHDESVDLYDQKPFIFFEFMSGQPVTELNSQQEEQVIKTAAQLQTITQTYIPPYQEFRWNYYPDLCLRLAQERAAKLDTPTAYAKLEWFEHQLAQIQLPDALPKGICHCDFHPSNILFEGDELVALLDFDDANYTYLNFDLANLIDGWAWNYGEDFEPSVANQIVQRYMQHRKLSDLEKYHLFDVHQLSIMFDGIWFFARGDMDDFYERQKIEHLRTIGRDQYMRLLCT